MWEGGVYSKTAHMDDSRTDKVYKMVEGHDFEKDQREQHRMNFQSPDNNLAEDWVTFSLWQRLHQKLKEALYSITLADLYYDARSWQAAQGEENNFVV